MTLSYEEALDSIYSLTDYEVKPQYRYAPDVHDPTRPARLLALMGDPHRGYPTIHIAGTKGKGSVAAICASALRAAGLRTGLYTSPHLQSFRERIQVDGCQIRPAEFASLVSEIWPSVLQVEGTTTFEATTTLAFLHFARRQVEVAAIEVGLGGRLDATNVVAPLVSVITSLDYDHTHLLGETLEEIAAEKGGIIKPGVPVISAAQPEKALAVLETIAGERGAPLTVIGRDWWYDIEEMNLDWQTFRAGRAGEGGDAYRLSLLGEHQAHNATVALAALDVAQRHVPALSADAIRSGLAEVEWPGRFQILHRRPTVVVDGAHTGLSARHLRSTLETLFPNRRLILVFGVTADKDVPRIIRELVPAADQIIATASTHPRAAPPAEVHQQLEQQGFAAVQCPSVSAALALAWEMAGPEDVICFAGSVFVAGEALTAWQERAHEALGSPQLCCQ